MSAKYCGGDSGELAIIHAYRHVRYGAAGNGAFSALWLPQSGDERAPFHGVRFAAGPAAADPAPGLFVFFGQLAASTCRNTIRTRSGAIAGAGKGTGLVYSRVLGRLLGHLLHDFSPPFSLCSSLTGRAWEFSSTVARAALVKQATPLGRSERTMRHCTASPAGQFRVSEDRA